uniref:Uncharacterized protein n=1 Tax=Aegilops tauschii TaxID=37682 RepID=N1R0D6_AEGTA
MAKCLAVALLVLVALAYCDGRELNQRTRHWQRHAVPVPVVPSTSPRCWGCRPAGPGNRYQYQHHYRPAGSASRDPCSPMIISSSCAYKMKLSLWL